MILGYIQKVVAEMIGIEKSKEVGLDFSFANDKRLSDDAFFELLEIVEEEMELELVDCAWRFETVKDLVDYINRKR